jgi:hypothetical protein
MRRILPEGMINRDGRSLTGILAKSKGSTGRPFAVSGVGQPRCARGRFTDRTHPLPSTAREQGEHDYVLDGQRALLKIGWSGITDDDQLLAVLLLRQRGCRRRA